MGNPVPENKKTKPDSSKAISHLMKNLLDNIYHFDFDKYDKLKTKNELNDKKTVFKNNTLANDLESRNSLNIKRNVDNKLKVPTCPIVVPKVNLQSKRDPFTSRESLKLLMNNIISIYTNNLATTGPKACRKKSGFKGLIFKLLIGIGAIYGSSQIGLWGSQQDSQTLIDKMKALLDNKDNEATRKIKSDIRAGIDNTWNSFLESFSFLPAAFSGLTSQFGGVKKQICGEDSDPKKDAKKAPPKKK